MTFPPNVTAVPVPSVSFRDALGLGDGTGGTDEAAEVTADTLGTDDMGLTGDGVEGDGLMTTVTARQLTTSAADTPFTVDLGIDDRGAVEVARLGKR